MKKRCRACGWPVTQREAQKFKFVALDKSVYYLHERCLDEGKQPLRRGA